MMTGRLARGLTALLLAALGLMQGVSGAQAPPPKKNPYDKLAQPWPNAEQLRQRRQGAEALPLFASNDPIAFTLAGDIKSVNKDRDPKSTKQYPAEIRIARTGGQIDAIPVKLAARGHLRRMARTCDSVPLRVVLDKERIKDTIFAGQSVLKLVVQCAGSGDYQQYLLREYLAYRISNILMPLRSFRARLAKITYVDAATGKMIATRDGMFLEDDGDVARRLEGRTVALPRGLFENLDPDTLTLMMVFEYMIGNTDVSIYALHNVVLVQRPNEMPLYPIPYDFDVSGLVHPPYAIPARGLSITSVTDRLNRGPCRTLEQIEPILANFNAKRDQILALPAAIAGMDKASREDAKGYLESFYSSVKNTKDVRRIFVDGGCSKASTM
jgi:hypothetical protein